MKSKNAFKKIEVKKPCAENWNKMTAVGQDKFCQSCSKMVIDFTQYSDKEILDFFNNQKHKKTCGRFEKTQLHAINTQLTIDKKSHGNPFLMPILATTLLVASACNTTKKLEKTTCEKPISNVRIIEYGINSDSLSTTKIIGKVLDEQNEPLRGVSVYIENSKIGTKTDFDGRFRLIVAKEPNETANLKIEYIGCETLAVPLENIKNKEIEVTLDEYGSDSFTVVGTVALPWYKRLWWRIFH
jgi:hypothetical protein